MPSVICIHCFKCKWNQLGSNIDICILLSFRLGQLWLMPQLMQRRLLIRILQRKLKMFPYFLPVLLMVFIWQFLATSGKKNNVITISEILRPIKNLLMLRSTNVGSIFLFFIFFTFGRKLQFINWNFIFYHIMHGTMITFHHIKNVWVVHIDCCLKLLLRIWYAW